MACMLLNWHTALLLDRAGVAMPFADHLVFADQIPAIYGRTPDERSAIMTGSTVAVEITGADGKGVPGTCHRVCNRVAEVGGGNTLL